MLGGSDGQLGEVVLRLSEAVDGLMGMLHGLSREAVDSFFGHNRQEDSGAGRPPTRSAAERRWSLRPPSPLVYTRSPPLLLLLYCAPM